MERELRLSFDKEGDVLDISLGEPKGAISKEIGDDILIRLDPETDEILGFTILNFEKRFEHIGMSKIVPITANFRLKR